MSWKVEMCMLGAGLTCFSFSSEAWGIVNMLGDINMLVLPPPPLCKPSGFVSFPCLHELGYLKVPFQWVIP